MKQEYSAVLEVEGRKFMVTFDVDLEAMMKQAFDISKDCIEWSLHEDSSVSIDELCDNIYDEWASERGAHMGMICVEMT